MVGAASAIAQAPVAARTEVELVGSACIVVRGSGIGGVELRCTLVSCIVVSERRSGRFVRTCTAVHKEEKEGVGREDAYREGVNHRRSWLCKLHHLSAQVKVVGV